MNGNGMATAGDIPTVRWDRASRGSYGLTRAGRFGLAEVAGYVAHDGGDSYAEHRFHRPDTVEATGFPSMVTSPFVTVTAERRHTDERTDHYHRTAATVFLTVAQAKALRDQLDAAIDTAEGRREEGAA